MNWLIYAVVMLSFVKTNTLNYLLLRVRLIYVVMLAKTGHITCPYNLLNRYIQAAGIDFSSNLMLFRSLHFVKSNAPYTLRSTGISYTHAFSQLGYSIRYAASIVLDQGALPPLRMRVLMISYLSAMDVGVQTKPGTVTLKII